MIRNKTFPILMTLLMLASAMPVLMPGAAAQEGSDVVISDAPGDVIITAPTPTGEKSPTPLNPPADISGAADITEVRFHGESPTEINLGVTVSSFEKPRTPQFMGTFVHTVCFKWSGTGATYKLLAQFRYAPSFSAEVAQTPTLDAVFFMRMVGDCAPALDQGSPDTYDSIMRLGYVVPTLDLAAGTWDVRIPRIHFDTMTPEGEGGPLPLANDEISELRAYTLARHGSRHLLYDETSAGATTLVTDTGNDKLKVIVPENIASIGTLGGNGGVPIYGVQTGTYQTLPLVIENWYEESLHAELDFEVVSGDDSKWSIRLIEGIPVPGKSSATVEGEPVEVPGSQTVTLVVHSDASVQHKETLRLLVKATSEDHPGVLGAGLVDVVGVTPPIAGTTDLYLHTTGKTCSSNSRWINTLASDPMATANEMQLMACVAGGNNIEMPSTNTPVSLSFNPDVAFGRDYVIDVQTPLTAKIGLKSVLRVPGQSDTEASVPSAVDLTVRVLAGPTTIGEGTVRGVQVDGTAKAIDVPLTFQPAFPGAKTRLVSADQPFRVNIEAQGGSRTFIVCSDACQEGVEREYEVPEGPKGALYLMTDISKIPVPIKSSERAGPRINITESGALISLRTSELGAAVQKFANPGGSVVYNLTVHNEGVNLDTAQISAKANQTGWTVEILPQTSFKLGVGESRYFSVRIRAPETGTEQQVGGITIVARSTVDKEAVAELPLSVVITQGQQIGDEELDPNLKADVVEESPPMLLAPTLAILGAAAYVARRRRL